MRTEPAVVGDSLSIKLIRRYLTTETVGTNVHLFDRVTSTNATLQRLAREGGPEGTVVLAERQSAGRGRLDKSWFSPPRVNLYASVLFRPAIAPKAVPVFSFIASLALVEAVRREGATAVIKWPNDVLVGGRKLAGVLAESAAKGDRVEHVILGVGVNLNVARSALRKGLGEAAARGATSLAEILEREIDRNTFTASFLALMEKWLGVYRANGPAAIVAAWRPRGHDRPPGGGARGSRDV
jgi:BirA family transcriptional regulator, biotin operon repressor / biotin---[acetyl-CoA-carboxylase] ligase